MTKAKKTAAKRSYTKRANTKPSRAKTKKATTAESILDTIVTNGGVEVGDEVEVEEDAEDGGFGIMFARDLAPLQFSLYVNGGQISGRVQENGLGGHEMAITTIFQTRGQTAPTVTDHLILPLTHSREFLARVVKMLDAAQADGLETGILFRNT